MDPYVVVTLGGQVYKTRTAKSQGKAPSWNQTFTFSYVGESTIRFKLFDNDMISDDYIGMADLALIPILNSPTKSYVSEIELTRAKGKFAGYLKAALQFSGGGDPHSTASSSSLYSPPQHSPPPISSPNISSPSQQPPFTTNFHPSVSPQPSPAASPSYPPSPYYPTPISHQPEALQPAPYQTYSAPHCPQLTPPPLPPHTVGYNYAGYGHPLPHSPPMSGADVCYGANFQKPPGKKHKSKHKSSKKHRSRSSSSSSSSSSSDSD